MPHPLQFESKQGRICVAWVWNREGTEKLVNGKQHSVWFVPTGMKGLPQNVPLNFRLEFPKSDLTIFLPSGISEIFRQMVSTPWVSYASLTVGHVDPMFFWQSTLGLRSSDIGRIFDRLKNLSERFKIFNSFTRNWRTRLNLNFCLTICQRAECYFSKSKMASPSWVTMQTTLLPFNT